MKALKLAMFALLIATLSACGPQQYSPEDCNELVQKIEKKQTLTEDDFEDMIDQMLAAVKYVKHQTDATKGNREKEEKLRHDPEFTQAVGFVIMFDFYLEKHRLSLSDANRTKLEQTREQLDELQL
ncbi:MAG: hypothetical protein HDS66_08010 [Bacteroidales bacterium]|nr:hypothetical protein [Bacteroidales bacterium]